MLTRNVPLAQITDNTLSTTYVLQKLKYLCKPWNVRTVLQCHHYIHIRLHSRLTELLATCIWVTQSKVVTKCYCRFGKSLLKCCNTVLWKSRLTDCSITKLFLVFRYFINDLKMTIHTGNLFQCSCPLMDLRLYFLRTHLLIFIYRTTK